MRTLILTDSWITSGEREKQEEVTVRELGGAIWSEIETIRRTQDSELSIVSFNTVHAITEVVMGVLARYSGVMLVNDVDMPVAPLPWRVYDGDDMPQWE